MDLNPDLASALPVVPSSSRPLPLPVVTDGDIEAIVDAIGRLKYRPERKAGMVAWVRAAIAEPVASAVVRCPQCDARERDGLVPPLRLETARLEHLVGWIAQRACCQEVLDLALEVLRRFAPDEERWK